MKPEDVRRIVDAASDKHALKRGGAIYIAGFLGAFTNVYPQKRWEKILQEKLFLPDESRFNDKVFYESACELSVANHIYCQHVSDFAVDKRVNPRNKRDVDVSCRIRATDVAVEVKCRDESQNVPNVGSMGGQPILSLLTAGRIPDHLQQLNELKQKIEGASAATVLLGKNRDLALKDCLVSANAKFSPDSSVDNLNILFLAAGYAGKMGEWFMNLFAPQGLLTSDPLHSPADFRLVDILILSNLKYWHEYAARDHDWSLRRVLLLLFVNPHRRSSCVSEACNAGLSLFPHLFERFNKFVDPAAESMPEYVLGPLRLIHFIGQGLSEEELERYFPVRLYPLGQAAIEEAKKINRSI
jgi:hypothetical protein